MLLWKKNQDFIRGIALYTAKIITITNVENITDKFLPFVNFKAMLDGIELKDSEKVIILQIEGTDSYLSIFPKKIKSIKDVEEELKKQDAKLNIEAKKVIEQQLIN